MDSDDEAGKPPKRKGRGRAKPEGRRDAPKAKTTLVTPLDVAKRFSVHATMLGVTKAALFEQMVNAHCRRFVVSDRQGPGGDPGPLETAA